MHSHTFKIRLIMWISLLLIVNLARAQDIFLLDVEKKDDMYIIKNSKNITKRDGYDNQPCFTADGKKVLFTSLRGEFTDIYEYDLESGITAQLTNTPEISEYTPIPNADYTSFTAVTENTIPDQSVWRYDRATGQSTWALASKEPVGYYAFNNRGEFLLWIRYGFVIQYVNPEKETSRFITGNGAPSRPHIIPGTDNFSFVHRQLNGEAWIKMLNPNDFSVMPIAPVVENKIDYCWTVDGTLLMGNGSKLYQWILKQSTQWKEVADLSKIVIRNITRMYASSDGTKIVVVGDDVFN